MPSRFASRKQKILEQLETPDDEYHDLSPKGSVDGPIRVLIGEINSLQGLVTTSSCSGRISVFLEGRRTDVNSSEPREDSIAGPGGKGGGGSWLFISHDPVPVPEDSSSPHFLTIFNLQNGDHKGGPPDEFCRYIHLKFEPMILHILAASLEDSRRVLTAALTAGFRESGAVSLNQMQSGELNPMVAVRSTGYSLDSIIGYQNDSGTNISIVDENYLQTLIGVANGRFNINTQRITRFRSSLLEQYKLHSDMDLLPTGPVWEDAKVRKQRKREEGLARQQALRYESVAGSTAAETEPSYDGNLRGMFD